MERSVVEVTIGGSGRALLNHLLRQMAILKVEVTDHREPSNREVAYRQSLERHLQAGEGPKQEAQGLLGPGGWPNVPDQCCPG